MKIAVIGVGFVGATVADFLETRGHTVVRVDPKYYTITVQEATADADGAVVCVNTPANADGTCDTRNLSQALSDIAGNIPVMIKSTVVPDVVETWSDNVVTNPEFLREAHAKADFANQHTFIIGATPAGAPSAEFFEQLFKPTLPNCEFITIDRTTASYVKYTHNAWLATKVSWFHELKSILPDSVDYSTLTGVLARFPTVGENHMSAPNSEGTLGYSGNCFPKDVSALNNILEHSILQQVEETNNRLRKIKDE